MSQMTLILLIATAFIVTFVVGWLARWLFDRLNTDQPLASDEAMQRLHEAEAAIEVREKEFSATEAQYANAYAQLEAELDAAMTGLGEARREAAELRAHISE